MGKSHMNVKAVIKRWELVFYMGKQFHQSDNDEQCIHDWKYNHNIDTHDGEKNILEIHKELIENPFCDFYKDVKTEN